MALNSIQKMRLDDILCSNMEQILDKGDISLRDMFGMVNDLTGYHIGSVITICSAFRRIAERNDFADIICIYDNRTFHFEKGLILRHSDKVRKDKNILYFNCYDGLYYDFSTKKFNMDLNDFYNTKDIFNEDILKALDYEWLFNYTTSLRTVNQIIRDPLIPLSFIEKMPSGLYEVIKENGNEISSYILSDFYLHTVYGKYYKLVRMIVSGSNLYIGLSGIDAENNQNILTKDFFNKLLKLINNEYLNGNDVSRYSICSFVGKYITLVKSAETVVLDTNRGLSYNENNLQNIIDKEKNQLLSRQLQRLNFIHEKEMGDYIIIVPQNQEDKQAEGRMQNNCVGYYYDERILSGNDLIFFIRKKDNPKHSYITCRYNLPHHSVDEYRKVNNTSVHNREEEALIKEIGDIITKNLR